MPALHRTLLLPSALLLAPWLVAAQTAIGLPPRVRPSIGAYGGVGGPAGPAAYVGGSGYRDLLNPAAGLFGVQAEAYARVPANAPWGVSLAAGVRSPALRLGAGAEVDVRTADVAPFLAFTHPLVRGGVLGGATLLHASWLFGGQNRLRAGITLPVAQPWVGRGRPRSDHVLLAPARWQRRDDDALRAGVLRINDLVVPPIDDVRSVRALLVSQSANDVIAAYHDALDRTLGRSPANALRAALLEHVLIPYNRLIGQKREPDDLAPFAAPALDAIRAQGASAEAALGSIIVALEDVIRIQRRRLRDERLVWLPLQLALRAEQYETQAQLDALLERVSAGEFSDSNQLVYVPNEQFQWEVFHSIRNARAYHVLWLHDFRGLNDDGLPDGVSYRQLAHGYLTALLEHVRDYDRTQVLPEYHIILDQYYYEIARSRLWLELLQDPLHARIRLPRAPPHWQHTIDSLQTELRSAVARSARLRQEAGTDAGALRRRIAVRVHITQQADASFFSGDLLPVIGLSDNALRDHRKLVFYDLTENDPYRGALIVSGMGVGEIYSGSAWEDRAAILRGTAAHPVKRAVARLFTGNGLAPEQLPHWLQAARDTIPSAQRVPAPRFDPVAVRALQLHNEVGYGDKAVTAAKAVLYSLSPPGAVLKVVNSLWINPLWTSLLLGQSLRGSRVLLMTAARDNAPFRTAEIALGAEMLARTLAARDTLATAIARADGMLRIGIYDVDLAVDDVAARIDSALARRARTPWLRQLEPFARAVIDSLRAVASELATVTNHASQTLREPPSLHVKAQFIASAEAWENLFAQPGWGAALAAYFRGVAQLAQLRPDYAEFHTLQPTTLRQVPGTLLLRQEVMARRSERVLYYLSIGSFNEDYRSALLDGEAVVVVSGFGAAAGIADFVLLPSLCTWVESTAELHRFLPRRASWLARALRILY